MQAVHTHLILCHLAKHLLIFSLLKNQKKKKKKNAILTTNHKSAHHEAGDTM